MSKRERELEELLAEILIDAFDDEEQLWAFRQAFKDNILVPCKATLAGEPVTVTKLSYNGNARRGLTAACERPDGSKHVVAAADIVLAGEAQQRYITAYRKWMGIALNPRVRKSAKSPAPASAKPAALAGGTPMEPGGSVELAVLSMMSRAAHCRLLPSGEAVTLRAGRLWTVVPGYIARIEPAKRWTYGARPYLSGAIQSTWLDAAALQLTPLRLESHGMWDPADEYWGEPGDPVEPWAKPIIRRGPRPMFEMEQVLPGEDPNDSWSDPIIEANDRKDSGDYEGAYEALMNLCRADLRCLDAHAHLGNLSFDSRPQDAIRNYEVGVRIGELSLPAGFDGVLAWGMIDNRPFLRCLQGFGLCLWRLGRFEEAAAVFDRMLWLNPSDNQGVRALIGPVRAKSPWTDRD